MAHLFLTLKMLEILVQENNLGSSLEFVVTDLIYKMNNKNNLFILLWKIVNSLGQVWK